MRHVQEVEPFTGAKPLPEPPTKGRVRYAPNDPFPPYRYVPGSGMSHPNNDPLGHSYSETKVPPHPEWTPHLWPILNEWLYGVDLYNHWYFWEAHEAWEGLWQVTEKSRLHGIFVQSLIQVGAAMLKVHLQSVEGVNGLWGGAEMRLTRVAQSHDELMGLRPPKLLKQFQSYFSPLKKGKMPRLDKDFPLLKLDM